MDPVYKSVLIKFGVLVLISPLIGFVALQIIENLKKAQKLTGVKKGIALAVAGILIAILLGWLQ